jgi:ABC-type multidrug transport system fused ATPase/permease subunit
MTTSKLSPLRLVRAALERIGRVAADHAGIIAAAPPVPLTTLVRRFWPFARPDRWWYLAGLVPVALLPLIEALEIWLFQAVVDDVLVPRDLDALFILAAAFLGLTVASGAISYVDEVIAARVSQRFTLRVRLALFEHLLRQSPDALDRRRLGDLLSRLSTDVGAIESLLISGVAEALASVVRMALFAGAMLLIDVQLAIISLVLAPLFWGAARAFASVARNVARERRRRTGGLLALAEESLSHQALVQASGRERDELERFGAEGHAVAESAVAAARLRALFNPVVELLEVGGALVVIGLGTAALTAGRLTLGELLVFLTYLTQLYRPVRDLGELANTAFAASGGAERIMEILDQPPNVADRPDALDPGRMRGQLTLDGVSYGYDARREVLTDVSLELQPGTFTAVVGASGAGKSTLVKLLLRFADPGRGRILLDGVDLRDLALVAVRRNIGVLLQEVHVLDTGLVDNVRYARPDATDDDVRRALEAAHAAGFTDELPGGGTTRLAQRGRRLSGGQRQRIAIARLLVQDPPVVVLDEPTASLDPEAARSVMARLRTLLADRTVVLVTHDPIALDVADRVVVLEGGRLMPGEHDRAAGSRRRSRRREEAPATA